MFLLLDIDVYFARVENIYAVDLVFLRFPPISRLSMMVVERYWNGPTTRRLDQCRLMKRGSPGSTESGCRLVRLRCALLDAKDMTAQWS
jgi:hypothetical protein